MVKIPEQEDDSRWEEADVADAVQHYLELDGREADELESALAAAGRLPRLSDRAQGDSAARFQVLALATQDLWLGERFASRSHDAAHFGRLRNRFFAILRLLGEHGAALEKGGLVILDPGRPWVAPMLAHVLASAPVRMDAHGVPQLVMPSADEG